MKSEGYIFDYGGTLDTGGCHWGKHIWHAYCECGVPVSEALFREAYVYAERELGRNPIVQSDYTFHRTLEVKLRLEFEYIAAHSAMSNTQEYTSNVLTNLYAKTTTETARSRAVLERIPQPKVLVSNFYGNIATVLEEFGLSNIFIAIIESAVVGIRKPDPRIFTLGVEALGMRPDEVMVVGDSYKKDILPAAAAGCQTTWLRGEQWEDGEENGDERVKTRVITRLEEIID